MQKSIESRGYRLNQGAFPLRTGIEGEDTAGDPILQLFNARTSTSINAKGKRCLPYAWVSNGWRTTDDTLLELQNQTINDSIENNTLQKMGTHRANPRRGTSNNAIRGFESDTEKGLLSILIVILLLINFL